MNNKKQIALNKLFNFLEFIGIISISIGVILFLENSLIGGLIALGIALIIMASGALFTPFCYLFDKDGVTFKYVIFPDERYLWKNVHSIYVNSIMIGSKVTLLEFFYESVFTIEGNVSGKLRFYMTGNMRKSFRTKHLLEKYYDSEITGYLFEDVKKFFNKNKEKTKINYDSSEVAIMEATARKEAKALIEPYADIIRQYNYTLKTDFIYITKDFKELKYRPEEYYEYSLLAELDLPELKDENFTTVSATLLNVRVKGNRYHGVVNKTAKEEIEFYLNDLCESVKNNEIQSYIESSKS